MNVCDGSDDDDDDDDDDHDNDHCGGDDEAADCGWDKCEDVMLIVMMMLQC